jgi:acetolactate synthase-1/3 small subunit
MRHTVAILVENKFGVLSRVAGLFSGRGFNIESLTVAPTNDPTVSRMTVVTMGNDQVIEQVTKQLSKLIDVIKVTDLTGTEFVDREMVLVRVRASEDGRAEVMRLVDIFRGKIVDVGTESYVIEVTGTDSKLEAFINLLKPFGVTEIVRTGKVAISRGGTEAKRKKGEGNG